MPAASLRYSAEEVAVEEELSSRTFESAAESGESPPAGSPVVKPGKEQPPIERQYYQYGEPVKINKRIYPNKKGGYILGDPIIVFVEILPVVKEIGGLWIHESIDDKLSIPYVSNIYRIIKATELKACELDATKNFSQICSINVDFEDNMSFETNGFNNLLTCGNIQLNNHQRLIYWYPIVPNESGIYSTRTSLRFYDNGKSYPDMDYSFITIVDEPNPRFDVGVTTINREVSLHDPLNITYDITYLGGASKNITVQLEFTKLNDYGYINMTNNNLDNVMRIPINLTINNTKVISKRVQFKSSGVYSLPGIIIYGDNYKKIFRFKGDFVTVKSWMERNKDYLVLYIGVLGIILGGIFGKCILKYSQRAIKYIRRKDDQGDDIAEREDNNRDHKETT